MKNVISKKHFSNMCIFILIVLFSCLIIYQIYLAITYKEDKYYSKLVEGFTMANITPQGTISCDNTSSLPSNFYNKIITDISNIETIYNNVTNIGNQVNGMINTNNANSSNTPINTITLSNIESPNTITPVSNAYNFCNAINTNGYNINTISENIQTIFTALKEFPNGDSATANTTFASLTNVNNIQCQNEQNVPISSVCQNENANINNINTLHGNTISLNNAFSSTQTATQTQTNNQYNSAQKISETAGVKMN